MPQYHIYKGRPCGSTARGNNAWTRSELMDELRMLNLPTNGTITDLCNRLRQHEHQQREREWQEAQLQLEQQQQLQATLRQLQEQDRQSPEQVRRWRAQVRRYANTQLNQQMGGK